MIRFAIYTAVSTDEQAKSDKESLTEQENRCRSVATARGWQEVVRPYVVPGESRTRYVNLRDAENDMPALHRLLEDAKGRLFDLVVLYDYSRLRDLLDPVAKTLSSYGVQIFSVNQPIDPVPPEEFASYASDSESMMRGMSQIISRWQINDLRRKHAYGVLARVRRGLHPSGTKPYGYTYNGPKALLTINPVQAAICVQIKDLYLKGRSMPQIMQDLNKRHVPAPRGKEWTYTAVHYILSNPFYAGLVRLGYQKKVVDPRTGKIKTLWGDPSKVQLSAGQHEPLWDRHTYDRLQSEMKRRGKHYKGRLTQRLSHLLYCAEHDRLLHFRPVNGIYNPDTTRWACRAIPGRWHVSIKDKDALAQLGPKLKQKLKEIRKHIVLPKPTDDLALLRSAREDLVGRRERLLDALEQGAIEPAMYAQRTEALDAQLQTLQDQIAAIEDRGQNRAQQMDALAEISRAIESTPDFLQNAPAQSVNAALRDLLEKITVDEEGRLELWFR